MQNSENNYTNSWVNYVPSQGRWEGSATVWWLCKAWAGQGQGSPSNNQPLPVRPFQRALQAERRDKPLALGGWPRFCRGSLILARWQTWCWLEACRGLGESGWCGSQGKNLDWGWGGCRLPSPALSLVGPCPLPKRRWVGGLCAASMGPIYSKLLPAIKAVTGNMS